MLARPFRQISRARSKPRRIHSSMSTHPDLSTRPSYRYWRDHGTGWADEYAQRRKSVPLYHIEEAMLADYMQRSAPARVLEFGCGVGRHLRYLRELPGIDVFGYDQSASMVAECRRWAADDWIQDRIAVGDPVGRLPYANQHFDLVFTVEVLVHVQPEDLDTILSELLRVTRWQLLHLEPVLDYDVHRDAHGGCWTHDLRAAYLRLGRDCEILPGGYVAHTPYRVVVDSSRPLYTWSPVVLSVFRELERDLTRGLHARDAQVCAADAEIDRLKALLVKLEQQLCSEQEQLAAAQALRSTLETTVRRLEAALDEERSRGRLDAVRIDDLETRLRRLTVSEQAFLRELETAFSAGR